MTPFEPKNNEHIYTDDEVCWSNFGIQRHDFQEHWGGNLINIFTVIRPLESLLDTRSLVEDASISLAQWILENQQLFESKDRYQIIVGWPMSIRSTHRQIAKGGGTVQQLASIIKGDSSMNFLPSWNKVVVEL